MSERHTKSSEWLAGFWAASLLFGGRYDDYATERDKFLSKRRPDMLAYINEIQRQLVSEYGLKARLDAPGIPADVPDGAYPMTINGKLDKVEIKNGMIFCCNFD